MKKAFRVAVIGCGAICGNHIKGILAAEQTVCALCDVDPEKSAQIIEAHGLEKTPTYIDYREMLDAEKPDIVHICTPHYLHAEMCVEALERNIHVLCEKPLSISMEQLASVEAAAKKSSAKLGVCHQNRYEPNFLGAKSLADSEGVLAAFGDVVWIRDAAYYASGSWRGSWEQEGGGVMINQALHTLDLLQWICGMPTHVLAHTANDHHKGSIEVEDLAAARFECPDGTLINFYATTAAGKSFPAHIRLRLNGKKTVHAENDLLTVNGEILREENREDGVGKSVWGNGHKALIAHFYHCIENDLPFPLDEKEGGKVVRLILSMYASNGKRIEIFKNEI